MNSVNKTQEAAVLERLRRPIGDVVVAWREERGMNQTELCDRSGLHKGYVSQIENNKIREPDLDNLSAIAHALGIPVLYLRNRILPSEATDIKEIPVDLSQGNDLPLGARIHLRRQHRGVRLSEMAREIGYDQGYILNVENNNADPSDELLEKIADYLEISVADLKEAPISWLAPDHTGAVLGFAWGAPPIPSEEKSETYETQKRPIGQRIERMFKMAHLSEEEEEFLADRLVAVTSELLKIMKGQALDSRES